MVPQVPAIIICCFRTSRAVFFVNVRFESIILVAASRSGCCRGDRRCILCDRCAVGAAATICSADAVCAFNRHVCRIFVMDAARSPRQSMVSRF
jgi:hypothetical protein